MLNTEQIKEIVHAVANVPEEPIDFGRLDEVNVRSATYAGVVKAKERPRLGRGGRTYTPTATRKCEAAIRKWAKGEGFTPVTYPVSIELIVREPCNCAEKIEHSLLGLTYNQKGDVDNFSKTILDALNGVAFADDKQITSLGVKRVYSAAPGFSIVVRRSGLNRSEYDNFCKLMRRASKELA
ncbi:MAG: RusA family crossover junction endodeoxyribonuclease [Ilumatobacter sp.]|nr:RusA family crossover junction endodeoxyribonuclease [Ilumatobacter sp.]